MISFESLPQEVLQDIVALLDPQSTVRCQGVCKALQKAASSEHVLRAVCINAGYLPEGQELGYMCEPPDRGVSDSDSSADFRLDAKTYPRYRLEGRRSKDVTDYQAFMTSSYKLEHARLHLAAPSPGRRMHTMVPVAGGCLDPVDDVLVTLTNGDRRHSLQTWDAHTGELLWQQEGIQGEDLQVSEGWVVSPHQLPYDHYWYEVQVWCFERVKCATNHKRGHLVNMGSIEVPWGGSMFRLRFPHLVILDARLDAITYNVATLELRETIDLWYEFRGGLACTSIEVDEDYVWLVAHTEAYDVRPPYLYRYGRGSLKLEWTLPPKQGSFDVINYDLPKAFFRPARGWSRLLSPVPLPLVDYEEVSDSGNNPEFYLSDLINMCIEPCTHTLCLLGYNDQLMLVPDYKTNPTQGAILDFGDGLRGPREHYYRYEKYPISLTAHNGVIAFASGHSLFLIDLSRVLPLVRHDFERQRRFWQEFHRGFSARYDAAKRKRRPFLELLQTSTAIRTFPQVEIGRLTSQFALTMTSTRLAVQGVMKGHIPNGLPENVVRSMEHHVILFLDFYQDGKHESTSVADSSKEQLSANASSSGRKRKTTERSASPESTSHSGDERGTE